MTNKLPRPLGSDESQKYPRPLGTQVLIKLVKKTPVSSLILPDSVNRPSENDLDTEIIVVSLGSKCDSEIKPGHKVTFRQGTQIVSIAGFSDLYVVPESNISCILNFDEV